jgi:RNA polymerase sigma factor (sigma-70 family)
MQAEGDVVPLPVAEEQAPPDFAAFFAEEHRGPFKALYFVTGNRADAAEPMQDAFLKLWERWDRVDRLDDPTGYLLRLALKGFRMERKEARITGSPSQLRPGPDGFMLRVLSTWSPGGLYLGMQAEGDVVRLPVAQEGPHEFATFFAEEHRELFRLLCFVTGNRADAADLMQDAFLKLWERWDRVQKIADPRAYLFRVALNGSRRRTRAALRAARRLVPIASSYDPFDEVNLRQDLRQILLSLSQRQRAALVLLDLYGYDSKEAARIMGIRPSTVRALATQGRAVLRQGGPHA